MFPFVLTLLTAFADEPDVIPPAWGATDATWKVVVPADGGPLGLDLEWRFTALRPGWWEVPLAGPGFVVTDVSGPAIASADGLRLLLAPGASSAVVKVHGTLLPSSPGAASLGLLPAAREHVLVDAPGRDVKVAGAVDGWLAAGDALTLSWAPHAEEVRAAPQPLAMAEVSTAVWSEPGALLTRSVVRWKVARGELDRFELDVAGLAEVEVDGANLARTTRAGDVLVLEPRAPVRGSFVVSVRGRSVLSGDAEVTVPAPQPRATARVDRYWTLGRSEEGELVPVSGPRSVSARALPEWARGLSDTPPMAYWQGAAPLRIRPARFEPLMGPDTVIERAELVVAASEEGRLLVRSTWNVRNERRQYLHVSPSARFRPMTARVSGEPVLVLSDGAGGIYVPLEKSVETVQGLLTFPVELTWIAEEDAWARRGDRTIALPAVDAPIQAVSWEVHLPRGRTAPGALPPQPAVEADEGEEELQKAVTAYKNNDFAASSEWLGHARAAGSTDANVDRLQSNLDVLLGDDGKKDEEKPEASEAPEDVATRRVRDLANAKTITMQVAQDKATVAAKKAVAKGDVAEAERYLHEVVALSGSIGVTEQKESADQDERRAEALALLESVEATKAQIETPPPETAPPETTPAPMGGDADGEPAANEYVVDGLITMEPPEQDAPAEPGVPAAAAPSTGKALEEEYVARVPVGRVYEEVVQATAGVLRGGGRSHAAKRKREGSVDADGVPEVAPDVADASPAAEPDAAGENAPAHAAAAPIVFEDLDIEGQLAPAADIPAGSDAFAPQSATSTTAPQGGPTAPSPILAPPPPPAPPRAAPEARAALQVHAAPLTLALPLGGAVVRSTAALLPAGAAPTLTLSYKTPAGAPR
jgi:hypothetical protein